jgi:hypothetical protein
VVTQSDLSAGLSKSAQRVLANAGYDRLKQLGEVTES